MTNVRGGGQVEAAYCIRQAKPSDVRNIYSMVYDPPHPNLRRRTLEDLTQMVDNGFIYLLTKENSEIVGHCYLKEPSTAASDEWEFGGAFIKPGHERKGLFGKLALVAVAYHLITNGLKSTLIGHVLEANEGPRKVLDSLGFEPDGPPQEHDPRAIEGLEHMVTNSRGMVVAHTLRFNPAISISVLKQAEVLHTFSAHGIKIDLLAFFEGIAQVLREETTG